MWGYGGYYTVARKYEFYVRVARTISHEWEQWMRNPLFLPWEYKNIFELTSDVLFIIWTYWWWYFLWFPKDFWPLPKHFRKFSRTCLKVTRMVYCLHQNSNFCLQHCCFELSLIFTLQYSAFKIQHCSFTIIVNIFASKIKRPISSFFASHEENTLSLRLYLFHSRDLVLLISMILGSTTQALRYMYWQKQLVSIAVAWIIR